MATIAREPTRYAHPDGHVDLVMDPTVTEYPGQFITCGCDGEIRIWNGLEDDSPVAITLADVCRGLAVRKNGTASATTGRFVAGSADTHGVHAYDLPDATPDGIVTRFTADVNCLTYSPDGCLLAAGAGDFQIKIIADAPTGSGDDSSTSTGITTLTGHSAPILSLAFDPSGTRLASAACNGDIKIWDLIGLNSGDDSSSSSSSRCLKTLGGVFPFSNDFDNSQTLCRLSWSPDGSSLLVPAVGGIKSFNTDSWDFQFTFTEESLTVGNVCSFSPCGKYLAVASTNGYLIIFDYAARLCAAKCETDKSVSLCALVWNPTSPAAKDGDKDKLSEVIAVDVEGNLGGYRCRLAPAGASSSTAAAAAAAAQKKAAAAKDGAENFQGLFDDDDGDFADAASASNANDDMGGGDDDDDDGVMDFGVGADDNDAGSRLDVDGVASRADSISAPASTPHLAASYPKMTPRQESFQPSATPRHLSNRFMAWNSIGIITQHKTENAIDVEFHDAAVHHAIHLNNDDNLIMADMNQNLVALASEGGDDADGALASKLMVLTIGSWDSTKQWSINLPEGESVEAVAVGADWVAVATSQRMLRIFSAGGIQREILSLPGPVVCMSGSDSQLVVAIHDGIGLDGEQKMALLHYRNLGAKPYAFKTSRFPLVLSATATLEWLGFSIEGSVVSVDSAGVVRMTKRRFQNEWIQIADTRKNLGKSDHYFIIAVSERDAHLRCIFCKGCAYPAVLPKPLVQTLPVSMPMAEPETDKSAAEASYWTAATLEQHEETVITMQEQLLKLVALSCKSDRDFRSVEAASLFPSAESLQLAIKYASRLRKMNLASKFGEIALRRRQEEEEEAVVKAGGGGGGRWRRGADDDENLENGDDDHPQDSQMSLFDDSPPPPPRPTRAVIRSRSRNDEEEEVEEAEEAEEDDGDEDSVPLLQLDKRKSQKPLTPLVATATPENASFKKSNGVGGGAGGNPFKKQMSMDASAEAGGKNVFAALAAPSLMKKASSFSSGAGNRFSKAAGKKGSAGSDVIKPPPVKRKTGAAALSTAGGVKKAASLAKSFEAQQQKSSAPMTKSTPSAASIVTSTPVVNAGNASAAPEDESPFAFWKRCNLEAIMADFEDGEMEEADEEAVTQHCVNKFRELPTAERKEWIAKFNTQKQQLQSQNKIKSVNMNGNDAEKAAKKDEDDEDDKKMKKRKLDLDEDEEKEQKPPSTKSKLAAFAFANGE